MRIKVIGIKSINADVFIDFESKIGVGTGRWKNVENPQVEHFYYVEFDIESLFKSGENAFFLEKNEFSIENKSDTITLNGFIDTVDDDGIAYFRLAEDCIIMIEVDPSSDTLKAGTWITLVCRASDFEVYAHME